MKKLLDSDWLRPVQFFLNTVQKRGNWMQKKVIKQAFWLDNEQRSSQMANQISCFQIKRAPWMAQLLIANHTVFLVQFGINLHLWVFQKAKLHSPKRLVQFQLFEKLTRANWFQIELKTVWLPLQIALHSVQLPLFIIHAINVMLNRLIRLLGFPSRVITLESLPKTNQTIGVQSYINVPITKLSRRLGIMKVRKTLSWCTGSQGNNLFFSLFGSHWLAVVYLVLCSGSCEPVHEDRTPNVF